MNEEIYNPLYLQTAIIRKVLNLYDFDMLTRILLSLDNGQNVDDVFPDLGPHSISEARQSVLEAEKQFSDGLFSTNDEVLEKMKTKYGVYEDCLVQESGK